MVLQDFNFGRVLYNSSDEEVSHWACHLLLVIIYCFKCLGVKCRICKTRWHCRLAAANSSNHFQIILGCFIYQLCKRDTAITFRTSWWNSSIALIMFKYMQIQCWQKQIHTNLGVWILWIVKLGEMLAVLKVYLLDLTQSWVFSHQSSWRVHNFKLGLTW